MFKENISNNKDFFFSIIYHHFLWKDCIAKMFKLPFNISHLIIKSVRTFIWNWISFLKFWRIVNLLCVWSFILFMNAWIITCLIFFYLRCFNRKQTKSCAFVYQKTLFIFDINLIYIMSKRSLSDIWFFFSRNNIICIFKMHSLCTLKFLNTDIE